MELIEKAVSTVVQKISSAEPTKKPEPENAMQNLKHSTASTSIPPTSSSSSIISSKKTTQITKSSKETVQTSDDSEDPSSKTLPPPPPVVTPPFPAADVIAEAALGVQKDNIENEYFDPSFFKNQVAMRQHDPKMRKPSSSNEMINEPNAGDESNIIRVIAKEVSPQKDKLCWITVKQKQFLGAGAFSDVFLGYVSKISRRTDNPQNELQVAIKKIWPDPSREDRQIGIHRHLDHVNLVKLRYYYVCIHPRTKVTMWTLIMDLMPSTVAHEQSRYIDKGKIMPLLYTKLFIYQTFAGLNYMEKANFLHRDIKPDNLLVCMETGRLKIGDFGSAKLLKKDSKLSAYQVTRYYRAPELCLKYTFYDFTIDIWAAGCILAELLTNRIVFYGTNNRDQLLKILTICGTPTAAQLELCVPGMTVKNEILSTNFPPANWLKIIRRYNKAATPVGADFLHKVLRYERNLRLHGKEALEHSFFDSLRNPHYRLANGASLPPLIGINC